ncbi:uncharacterized protein F5891DRAFT_1189103 [Suillus fuscotomentosus]|uniref:Uncharacterized protein n=1 Tax=Suillus fuscotomentosus TaxID=1912939 RepID=A0AAD4E5N2_9AGAM|nr:uncharacterized protein F5891DRAFT_1189103 [Suillus fuscotomentosus]KAG1900022.1 hypothetical protein F5891DRAFT_1189103 [Suillus fuscotomentosus]
MGQAITEVVMTHGSWVTVLSPLILSAAAELQEHLDGDNAVRAPHLCGRRSEGMIATFKATPSSLPPSITEENLRSPSPKAGPSQPPSLPAEERGRGTQHGKHPRASNAHSRSRPAISKKQRGKSRAAIDTDDELDEDELVPPTNKLTVVDPPAQKSGQYVEVASEEEMDANEEPIIQIKPTVIVKKGSRIFFIVALSHSPSAQITTNFSGAVLTEDEFADTSAPTWAPRCGQCVARDLICRQGINKNNGRTLKVCALCSHLKIRCGGKGSNPPPAKGKSSAGRRARSKSRRRPSPIQEDPAPDAGPLVEEEPAPPATPAVANPELSQTLDDPVAAGPSSILAPSCIAHDQELQALKMEVTALCATVEALMGQVVAGDQLLQAAYMRVDAQDNCTDLLAGKIADIHRLVDPPSSVTPTDIAADECPDLAAGPAQEMEDSACLPGHHKDS